MTPERIREIFKLLETGDGAAFFTHVADDVDWTVEGTHPLAGHYRSKQAFFEATFARLNKVLKAGTELHVEHLLVQGDQAAVELRSYATANNGKPFANRYCWIVSFRNDTIVQVRAYLDSALVAQTLAENERPAARAAQPRREAAPQHHPS